MSLGSYLRETKAEMTHVSWPTRQSVLFSTVVVIGVSILVALLLGLFDLTFTSGLRQIISGDAIETLPLEGALPAGSATGTTEINESAAVGEAQSDQADQAAGALGPASVQEDDSASAE